MRIASTLSFTLSIAAASILLTGCVSTGEYRDGMDGVNSQIEAMRLSREEFDRRQAILDTKIKAIEESPTPAANLDQQVRNLTGQLDRANGRIAELERMLREKLEQAEVALNNAKLNHQVTPLENPSQIKAARRDIARMKTVLRQRELNK